jgi:hypothetical protein
MKGGSTVIGWPDINKAIGKAGAGDTLEVFMNNVRVLPAGTLEAMRGKDITLILDLGNGIQWTIYGKDIVGRDLADFCLKVVKDSNTIPYDVVNEAAGGRGAMQFSLVHEGDFGFTATLSIPVNSYRAGYFANLFYHDGGIGAFEYITSGQLDDNGAVGLSMTHGSDYLVILDTVLLKSTSANAGSTVAGPADAAPGPETITLQNRSAAAGSGATVLGQDVGIAILVVAAILIFGGCLVMGIYLHRKTKENAKIL